MVTASGFSNMDPALRRLAWLCVLELCIEYKSNCSNRDGDVDNEHQPSLFKVVTEEEKQNVRYRFHLTFYRKRIRQTG